MPSDFEFHSEMPRSKSALDAKACFPAAGRDCPLAKTKHSVSTPITIPASAITFVSASDAGSIETDTESIPRAIMSAPGTRTESSRGPEASVVLEVDGPLRSHPAHARTPTITRTRQFLWGITGYFRFSVRPSTLGVGEEERGWAKLSPENTT